MGLTDHKSDLPFIHSTSELSRGENRLDRGENRREFVVFPWGEPTKLLSENQLNS